MATPTQRLAQAHRLRQRDLAEALANRLRATWTATVVQSNDRDAFLERGLSLVKGGYQVSERLARGYYLTARALDGGRGRLDVASSPLVDDAVVTSLAVKGFVELEKRLEKGFDLIEALDMSREGATGAAVRHMLNGGRTLVRDTSLLSDRYAVGYQRITREGACYFCAALASRGPVYKADSFDSSNARFTSGGGDRSHGDPRAVREGEVRVHDFCQCAFQVVFRRDEAMPDLERSYADLWTSVAKGKGDQMKRFRSAYEGRRYMGASRGVSS